MIVWLPYEKTLLAVCLGVCLLVGWLTGRLASVTRNISVAIRHSEVPPDSCSNLSDKCWQHAHTETDYTDWRSNDGQTNLVSSKTTFAIISVNSNSKLGVFPHVDNKIYLAKSDNFCVAVTTKLLARFLSPTSPRTFPVPSHQHQHQHQHLYEMNFVIAILFLYAAACAFRCVVVHMHVLGVQVLISICLFSAVYTIYSLNSAPVFILSGCPSFSLRLVYMG
uniref:Uncharacterized protein n=1 Tax=Glossina austeni TaxID=7395 RepID=A0A1A9VKU3_GLOAU